MAFPMPRAGEPVSADYIRRLDSMDRLAHHLDTRFRVPATSIRFGWDPLVGCIPFVGDLVMAAVGVRLVVEAHALGAKRSLVLQMIGNVAIDFLVGAIPFVGPVFDAFFRSNQRNMLLMTSAIHASLNGGIPMSDEIPPRDNS